jgi:hypothetical protein
MTMDKPKIDESKQRKPAANHPWKRAVPSKVHAWAHEKSKTDVNEKPPPKHLHWK